MKIKKMRFALLCTLILFTSGNISLFAAAQNQGMDSLINEEVFFLNKETRLAGTLTLPSGSAPYPAVIFISGSGPQDRDGVSGVGLDFRYFAILGEYLASKGFAVLRYDDRGYGESTGNYIEATEDDFFEDAKAAIKFLWNRKDIRKESIGLVGHSEGALIAANVASYNPEVAFVISLAGGAVDGYNLLLSQAEKEVRATGMTEEELSVYMSEQQQIFNLVLEKNWVELEKILAATIRRRLDKLPGETLEKINIDEYVREKTLQSLITFQLPRYQYLLNHDFGADWEQASVPVLALFGELDVQVDAEQNKNALEHMIDKNGKQNITIIEIAGANHLFMKAQTGSMSEYSTLPKQFAPDFLDSIYNWLCEIPQLRKL